MGLKVQISSLGVGSEIYDCTIMTLTNNVESAELIKYHKNHVSRGECNVNLDRRVL